ncbi:MAG: EAL domain-containing protein [Microcoleaceae cyanobacterium]
MIPLMAPTAVAPAQVMIVEDELIVAENVAKNLKKFGYSVSAIVDSGEAAVQTARTNQPDMVLMDIMLQGNMDGVEAAGEIHRQLQIPVIYMTAYGDDTTLERTKKTEPYGYLIKPFKPRDMRATIEVALNRYRAEQSMLRYLNAQISSSESSDGYEDTTPAPDLPLGQSEIAVKLRHALGHQQLHLNYQPQLSLKTGKIIGAEALLRWYDPEDGMIPPNTFIAIAEATGLIYEIDEWVLKKVCQQTLSLHRAGFSAMNIAVNLSGKHFNRPDINRRLLQIAQETELDPKFMRVELTESSLVQDIDVAIQNLTQLNDSGIKIAVDDFGTGYSSLRYLQHLPFDTLKIDQSFVRDVDRNAKHQAIVKAMIGMAHQLNLKVVAEGVETQAELDFLRQHDCDAVQGYLISRPISWTKFQEFLRQYQDRDYFSFRDYG